MAVMQKSSQDISQIVITTNTPEDLSRIWVGKYVTLNSVPGVYRVEEQLPGCQDPDCIFRHFRAQRFEFENIKPLLKDSDCVEYLEEGNSIMTWEQFDPEEFYYLPIKLFLIFPKPDMIIFKAFYRNLLVYTRLYGF
jgi:hypothetical protein